MAEAWFREWRRGMTESCCSKRSGADWRALAGAELCTASLFIGAEGGCSKGDGVWCSSSASTHTVLSL